MVLFDGCRCLLAQILPPPPPQCAHFPVLCPKAHDSQSIAPPPSPCPWAFLSHVHLSLRLHPHTILLKTTNSHLISRDARILLFKLCIGVCILLSIYLACVVCVRDDEFGIGVINTAVKFNPLIVDMFILGWLLCRLLLFNEIYVSGLGRL